MEAGPTTAAILFGWGLGQSLIAGYHVWKARRVEVPLRMNRKGEYEDHLIFWERTGKIGAWALASGCVIGSYFLLTG